MGDIKVGDLVYGGDGLLHRVNGVFPQREKKQVFVVILQDGRQVRCCEDHLWSVRNIQKQHKVLSVKDMLQQGIKYDKPKGPEYKFKVPNCKPVKFMKKSLPIDPYILGCLLGNGTLTTLTPKIATDDEFILDYFKKHLPNFEIKYDSSTNNNYTITSVNGKDKHLTNVFRVRNDLSFYIRQLGLDIACKQKFIPSIYKFSSTQQRLELIQGLMDTDGHILKSGHGEFTNTSEQLIDDMAWILRSLGIRCRKSIDNREGEEHNIKGSTCTRGKVFRLYINTDKQIVKTPHKLKFLQNKKTDQNQDYVSIIEIIETDRYVNMQCISLDSADHTYLTDDFVVTHNTDTLLMDFASGVGVGYGADYRGLLLREATTELKDVIAKSKKWFPRMFPGAKFNEQKSIWTFPAGETLWFNYARVITDYDQYHGHEYAWIGWEELTNHPIPDVYLKLMACNRTSNSLITPKYRATCNPAGPGHAWVKLRFIDTIRECRVFTDSHGMTRAHIFIDLDDNKSLLTADPTYKAKMMAMTENNEMLRKAWVDASWDLIIGGYFTDIWRPKIHIINPFKIPYTWKIQRSFDWGSSRPWCVTYGAKCNGDQPEDYPIHFPKDSIIVIDEMYGWTGEPNVGDMATSNTIASKVLSKDKLLQTINSTFNPFSRSWDCAKVSHGPADNSIWDVKDGKSIGTTMAQHKLYWSRSYKGPGSRKAGLSMIRNMLDAAIKGDSEQPHLYFFPTAFHHIRVIPLQQRDAKNPEDIDTDLEDHPIDSLRYLLNRKNTQMRRGRTRT